ncbi:MAG: hypothetical protein IPM82_27660 [Saprospiraceae bacterium]|nr:hypothetical protein [Saprospiraceae bacterium]
MFNPLEVQDGEFELTFTDENMSNDKLDQDVFWKLTNVSTGEETVSDKSLALLNEQIFGQYGFTVSVGQTTDAGDCSDDTFGAIGAEQVYRDLNAPSWFNGIKDGFSVTTLPGVLNVAFDYIRFDESNWDCHYENTLATMGNGNFVPYQLTDFRSRIGSTEYPFFLSPAWRSPQNSIVAKPSEQLSELNNVDIVFTSDKSKWSRCIVVEMANNDYTSFALKEDGTPVTTAGSTPTSPILSFDLRNSPSVGKDDSDGDGLADPDGDGIGMGWFPGYAVDVETGMRLNIFFGENSAYSAETGYLNYYNNGKPNGADMMFNPNSQLLFPSDYGSNFEVFNSPLFWYAGGQHFVYVTNEDYDEEKGQCKYLRGRFDPTESDIKKVNGLKRITWAGLPLLNSGTQLLDYKDGLIPNDLTIKLRVDNPYEVATGTGDFNGYPTYRFKLDGQQADSLDQVGISEALDKINLVPNPYYAFSDYEDGRLSNVVKITNLPAKCVVTIYSLDGKFIRQYNRAELPGQANGSGTPSTQIIPDIEWDLKNSKGIPVSAGVYLVHVDAGELGERTLKWFGITRQYDPTGL